MPLTTEQTQLLAQPLSAKIFLQGAAGTGKTTAGIARLQQLLRSGVPAHQILVFTPQRTLSLPYEQALREDQDLAQSLITPITLGGLARRMVDLFWPAISPQAGFAQPDQPPHFLTLETAQYYLAHLVRPLIEDQGYFESLTVQRNRIYSQILDNLNKTAIVGFPIEEIGLRLKGAWGGDIEQLHVYDDVQDAALRFRTFCLENNLLDFSLQVETFLNHLWPSTLCQSYLTRTYRHLIVDNVEEDPPVSHDLLRAWLPQFDSALVIFDQDAGYRFFLGADVQSAFALHESCDEVLTFKENLVNQPAISQLRTGVRFTINKLTGKATTETPAAFRGAAAAIVTPEQTPRYFPAMIAWVAEQALTLIQDGTPPGEIVILAPFMSDVLRFSLAGELQSRNVPHHSHRPSRALREEPATQTLLTLASLAFPEWHLPPQRINLAFALMQAIAGLDLVRAQLLTAYIYDETLDGFKLKPFAEAPPPVRERVSFRVGEKYDQLRDWLAKAEPWQANTLDFFLNRLFGEVLGQPGFGFHDDLASANTIATLIESIQKFRWALGQQLDSDSFVLGKEYVQMVSEGVIAAQYIQSWQVEARDSVFLAPAYTFLIQNRPVDYQFWLDIGNPSWYQRLNQPLTQPYVLSRHWQRNQIWDADDELAASHDTLSRLTLGLLSRCRKKVFLGMSDMDMRGYENRGLLLRIFQQALLEARRRPA